MRKTIRNRNSYPVVFPCNHTYVSRLGAPQVSCFPGCSHCFQGCFKSFSCGGLPGGKFHVQSSSSNP